MVSQALVGEANNSLKYALLLKFNNQINKQTKQNNKPGVFNIFMVKFRVLECTFGFGEDLALTACEKSKATCH